MKRKNSTLYLTRGAMIAALYVAITWLCSVVGLSSGVIQFRVSEAMCILPLFLPEAVPALFIGCMLSNLIAGGIAVDIIFGAVATLIGAVSARLMRKLPERLVWLATVPTVLANALIVPLILIYGYGSEEAYAFIALTVFIGEAVCAGIGGTLLYPLLKKLKFFKKNT